MNLHGQNIIGNDVSGRGATRFKAVDPSAGAEVAPEFSEATDDEVDRAVDLAAAAFATYHLVPKDRIAAFLDRAAEEILALGDELLARAQTETGLPQPRLTGERGRCVNQLKMFAALVREGSWVEARIDRAMPDRKPQPRSDLRRMLVPIGPVIVFGAGNFPFAFSVAGGDTVSALAAGNPVVVKAHPGHPGTSELVARAVQAAAAKEGLPAGVFSMVHGRGTAPGLRLVRHPLARAVGFTGSLKGGRALFDAAAARPHPIPVYAEMGSANPVFVLPEALRTRGLEIARGLIDSVTLGAGQFCTNPGLVFGIGGAALDQLTEAAGRMVEAWGPGTMLQPGIRERYVAGIAGVAGTPGVRLVARSTQVPDPTRTQAGAALFAAEAETFLAREGLREEVFGPSTIIVACGTREALLRAADAVDGALTATVHGTARDLEDFRDLIALLETKAGRLVCNGFPTGVEVCPSMQHGGPYPAATDVRSTSVGTAAITRFARPICYQDFPEDSLPVELRNQNPRGLWRLVDGEFTRGAC